MCRNHAPIGHTGLSLENNKWLATGSTDPSFRWGDCSSQKPTNADPPWLRLKSMSVGGDVFSSNWKPQYVILNTRLIARSLLPSQLADQQFIQLCKSVQKSSHLAVAGALRILLHFPLLPGVCSNDGFGILAPRLRPWFGLRRRQEDLARGIFWYSSQRFRQCSFIRFQHERRHRPPQVEQFGQLEQDMAKDKMMKEAWHS